MQATATTLELDLEPGALPWQPVHGMTNHDVIIRHDKPLFGAFDVDGRRMMYWAVDHNDLMTTRWLYFELTPDVEQLLDEEFSLPQLNRALAGRPVTVGMTFAYGLEEWRSFTVLTDQLRWQIEMVMPLPWDLT